MSKITKQEFFDTLNFLINNKEKIDKNTFEYNNDMKEEFLYTIPLGIIIFSIIFLSGLFFYNSIPKDYKIIAGSFSLMFFFLNFFSSLYLSATLNEKISKRILKNNCKNEEYSLISIFRKKHKKNTKDRISKIKNLHKLFKNNLPKKIRNIFLNMKYSKILGTFHDSPLEDYPTEYMINQFRKFYSKEHSEEIAWQHFSEYFLKNHNVNDTKIQRHLVNIQDYFNSKNEELEKTKMLISASGVSEEKEYAEMNQEINKEIILNNKLKILKI